MAVKVHDTQDVERTLPEVAEVGEYARSKVAEEKSRALAAEGELEDQITAEKTRAEAAESTLTENLNKEISDRQAAVEDEAEERASADSSLSQSIQEEAQRAEGAEQALQTAVNTKLARVDGTTTNPQVYVKSASGSQQMVDYGTGLVGNGLVQRDANGQVVVPTPTVTTHAVNKQYVDQKVANIDSTTSGLQEAIDAEKARAMQAESGLQDAIDAEESARASAISELTERVAAEETARQQGDSANNTKIESETTRAQQAESALQEAINAEESRATQVENGLSSRLTAVEGKIPAQASAQNQLADKNYVTDLVSKSAADRVTYNQAGDPFPTRNALLTASTFYHAGAVYTPNEHDYALVVADEGAPSPFTGGQTRFEWNGSTWEYAYGINERPFTSEEQEALDSGITAEKVAKIDQKLDKSSSKESLYGTDKAGNQVMISRFDYATASQGAKADTAYQKPSSGIPKSDLVAEVQESLSKADSAYQKPLSGIPKTDLDSSVGASISKADTAYQKPSTGIPESDLSSSVNQSLDRADSAYQKPSSGIPNSDLDSSVRSSLSKADTAFQTSEGDILPVENGGTGVASLENVKVGSAKKADSAVADGDGNEIPKTYAKATIVPVRYNGGYWSTYGGQSAKAGDLALIIDNTGSTAYQKGCLYKVSSASGSSMSLSPTRIADWVSAQAGALNGSIDMGKNDITFSTEDPGDLVWAQDGSTENARIYYDNINEMLILRAASGSDIVGGKVTVNGSLYEKDHKVVTENKIKSYIAFNGENPAELFGGTWEDFSYQVPLQDNFYIDFTGKSYTYNLNNAFDTVKSCALICITCTSAGEKARGIWAYTPSAGHNYQGKQLAEISVTNGYDGNTISVSVASGAGNVLSVNTSFSGTWRLTVIPLQAADQLAVLWKRLS